MRRLDFETNVIKNPVSGDDPGTNLARRWRNKVYYVGSWWRCYWFIVFVFVYSLLYITYVTYLVPYQIFVSHQYVVDGFIVPFSYLFIILMRLQASTIPGLIIIGDTKTTLVDHFRMTLISGNDATRAMFFMSLNLGALPMAIASIPMGLFMLYDNRIMDNVWEYAFAGGILLAFYIMIGLALSAFGIIGALVRKSPGAVLISVAAPIVILFLTSDPIFIQALVSNIFHILPLIPGLSAITLFLMPEVRIAQPANAFGIGGPYGIHPVMPYIQIGTSALWLLGWTACLWMGLWFVLKRKLRAD